VTADWILFALLAALLAGGAWLVQRRERTPTAYWLAGWISASIGGLLTMIEPRHPGPARLTFAFGTLFPWFLLAGSLVLAERRVPRWLLPLGLSLGGLRTGIALAFGAPPAYLAGFVLDLPAVVAAAVFAQRAVPREGASATQRLLAPSLLLLTGAGALHLGFHASGRPLDWVVVLWMLATPPLLGLQLRVGAEWSRRHLTRAQRALEDTIAERTAELARVNASLRESEERYRVVSELSSDLSFGMRLLPDGTLALEWITDAFGRLTGRVPSEMDDASWLALIHPEDREQVRAGFRRALLSGTATFSYRMVGRRGELRWLEVRERVTRGADGVRVLGAARDVTEARLAEQERARLERQMQEAQRLESLGLVTGGVAHDFNNLLTVILGNARLALAELPAGHALRPRLERMLAAAEHGAGLTEQMLVYAGRAPQAPKPVNLSALVGDMLDLARASLPEGARLHETLGAELWVQGDETQLRQVVLNLVANAGEALAGREGSVTLRTELAEADAAELAGARGAARLAPGRHALLEVADDGAGMDAATQQRVFEPFFSTKLSGRGLGLAAVLGIVRGHGGVVSVASQPGGGSRFRVWLPSASEARDARAPATGGAARRARVLVIDDQEPVLELAREFLGRAGYRVETALGGRAGLARFHAAPADFDVVMLDLAMPELDGEQLGREIRAAHPYLPLLLVSGYEADTVAARLSGLHPAAFLRKPYSPDDLSARLAALLAG
jgi:PAS domain S-box-containing protein